MQWQVEILFAGEWWGLKRFATRDDAEWAIATWRQENGGNGRDTGFHVVYLGDKDKENWR